MALPDLPAGIERSRDPEKLQAWLEAHQVTHVRGMPLFVVEPFLARSFRETPGLYGLEHLPVTAPLDGSLGAATQVVLQEAVWTWLSAEAERVRRGLELEQDRAARARAAPTDARLIPLMEVLDRARARVRAHAVPRLLPGRPNVTLHERPLLLYVEEPGRPPGPLKALDPWRGLLRMRVSVDPRALLEGQEALSCWCTSSGEARCVHALSALDTLLDTLVEPLHAQFNARLAELLFEVPAREILGAFEQAAQAQARALPSEESRVSFRLDGLEDPALKLSLYLHRPLKKGGFSKGTLATWRDREEIRARLSDPRELEAFELAELASRLGHSGDGYFLLMRAIRLLTHSSRLFATSRLDVPLQVHEAPLGFAFAERGPSLTVHPAIDGVAFSLGELRPPPSDVDGLLPWLLFEPLRPRLTLVNVPPSARIVLTTLREYGTRLPAGARPALLRSLASLASSFPVSLPESLEVRSVHQT